MKKIIKISICLSLLLSSVNSFACKTCGCSAKKNTHTHNENSIKKDIDLSKSSVKWIGEKVTGSHEGNISIKEGHLHFDDNTFSGGNIIIDMSTIECTDLDGEAKLNIEGHLSSDDFFGVKKFPTARLEIIKADKAKYSKNKYNISAILEIKNIKQNIEFDAVIEKDNAKVDLVIDRTKFNVRYGSGSFFENLGDKMIYDDFTLSVNLEF